MGCGTSKKLQIDTKARVEKAKKQDQQHITTEDIIEIHKSEQIIYKRKVVVVKQTQTAKPIRECYQILKFLRKSSYHAGEIRRVINKLSGKEREAKILTRKKKTDEEKRILLNEVGILSALDHPNIQQVFEYFADESQVYIILGRNQGPSLRTHIEENQRFSEQWVANFLKKLMSAIIYCHSRKVSHRDISPANIIYETEEKESLFKIVGWDISLYHASLEKTISLFKSRQTTYVAPEVLQNTSHYVNPMKGDIWSVGIIMYELIYGFTPFRSHEKNNLVRQITTIQQKYKYEGIEISDEANDLINQLLNKNCKKRISAKQVLRHKFFQKYSTHEKLSKKVFTNALQNLNDFQYDNTFQLKTWIYFVNMFVSEKQKSEIKTVFNALDKNNDGVLSRNELVTGLSKTMGAEKARAHVDDIMKRIDINNDNEISYSEFMVASINRERFLTKDRLRQAFMMFDKDQNGTIDTQEILDIFVNSNFSKESILEAIKSVDKDGDGEISFKEFGDILKRLIN